MFVLSMSNSNQASNGVFKNNNQTKVVISCIYIASDHAELMKNAQKQSKMKSLLIWRLLIVV